MGERGAVADRHERLGADVGQRAQAGTQAGGEDHRGKHGDEAYRGADALVAARGGHRRVGRTAGRVVGACPCAAAPSCASSGRAALALAVVAMACGSSAAGVDACKSIEEARCNQLPELPQRAGLAAHLVHDGTAVEACVRYYDTACGHGLSIGDRSRNGRGERVRERDQPDGCGVVAAPETDPACAWLVPPAEADAGDGGDARTATPRTAPTASSGRSHSTGGGGGSVPGSFSCSTASTGMRTRSACTRWSSSTRQNDGASPLLHPSVSDGAARSSKS